MKTLLQALILLLLSAGLAMASQTDEERLDSLLDLGSQKKAQYLEQKKAQESKKEPQTDTRTVTTVTVTTQVTVIQDARDPGEVPAGGRIGFGTLVLAEFLGAITPGLGLAHFTVGDSRGGLICLGITGTALALYLTSEILVETRSIDNPTTYGIMHYGALGLYLASYIYDLVGAPLYTMNYNRQFTASIRSFTPRVFALADRSLDLALNLVDIQIRF